MKYFLLDDQGSRNIKVVNNQRSGVVIIFQRNGPSIESWKRVMKIEDPSQVWVDQVVAGSKVRLVLISRWSTPQLLLVTGHDIKQFELPRQEKPISLVCPFDPLLPKESVFITCSRIRVFPLAAYWKELKDLLSALEEPLEIKTIWPNFPDEQPIQKEKEGDDQKNSDELGFRTKCQEFSFDPTSSWKGHVRHPFFMAMVVAPDDEFEQIMRKMKTPTEAGPSPYYIHYKYTCTTTSLDLLEQRIKSLIADFQAQLFYRPPQWDQGDNKGKLISIQVRETDDTRPLKALLKTYPQFLINHRHMECAFVIHVSSMNKFLECQWPTTLLLNQADLMLFPPEGMRRFLQVASSGISINWITQSVQKKTRPPFQVVEQLDRWIQWMIKSSYFLVITHPLLGEPDEGNHFVLNLSP